MARTPEQLKKHREGMKRYRKNTKNKKQNAKHARKWYKTIKKDPQKYRAFLDKQIKKSKIQYVKKRTWKKAFLDAALQKFIDEVKK